MLKSTFCAFWFTSPRVAAPSSMSYAVARMILLRTFGTSMHCTICISIGGERYRGLWISPLYSHHQLPALLLLLHWLGVSLANECPLCP
jgi:hypothetical protein